jgi:predicted GIY-YIG superfamily endonuclease
MAATKTLTRRSTCKVSTLGLSTFFEAKVIQSGITSAVASDVDRRLEWHNAGPRGYTRRHRPWRVLVSIEFQNESAAARFEKYLKSGSGRAFAKRHVDAV